MTYDAIDVLYDSDAPFNVLDEVVTVVGTPASAMGGSVVIGR